MDEARLILKTGRLLDGTGGVQHGKYVVIHGNRFHAIADDVHVAGAPVVDLSRYTAIPGLIDVHVHLFDYEGIRDQYGMSRFAADGVRNRLQSFLAHGITTVKSCGDPEDEVLALRARIDAGDLPGPRLLVVGPGITSQDGHPAITVYGGNPWMRPRAAAEVSTPEQARAVVGRLAEKKVDGIKLLNQGGCAGEAPYLHGRTGRQLFRFAPGVMRAAIDEAHHRNLRVTVHTQEQARASEAVNAGADALEHAVSKERLEDPTLIPLLLERRTTVAPTLVISKFGDHAVRNASDLARAGVPLVVGSDVHQVWGAWGSSAVDEIEGLLRIGYTPGQAILGATLHAAQHVGRSTDLGSIESGKMADMVLLDGDPLSDIGALRRVVMVIKDGAIFVDNRTTALSATVAP